MSQFRVGVTPDFFVDARGLFEEILAERLGGAGIEYAPMAALEGNRATAEAIADFDAIFALATKFDAAALAGAPRLALIARWGVGYDMIDTEALTAAGAALAITPDAVRTPVAEAIFTLMLALAKNLRQLDRSARGGQWRAGLRLGRNLRGQVLGSVGCGNIGQEMFRLAGPFGFSRLLAFDPYVDPARARELGVELVDLETVFAESDFVCVNALLNAETRGLVDAGLLRRMKPTACLINTARGPIVDEAALVRALEEGWIAGAGLDVFETEPPRADHPLFGMDNVIVTPHALPWTAEITRDNGHEACDHILQVARGEVPGGLVNRAVLEQPAFREKLIRFRENAK